VHLVGFTTESSRVIHHPWHFSHWSSDYMRLKITKHISRSKGTNAEKYKYVHINMGS
jgi:hypothetical protein